MRLPPTFDAPFQRPAAQPTTVTQLRVTPAARASWNHVSGEARGAVLTADDLNAFTWWTTNPPWRAVARSVATSPPQVGAWDTTRTRH